MADVKAATPTIDPPDLRFTGKFRNLQQVLVVPQTTDKFQELITAKEQDGYMVSAIGAGFVVFKFNG